MTAPARPKSLQLFAVASLTVILGCNDGKSNVDQSQNAASKTVERKTSDDGRLTKSAIHTLARFEEPTTIIDRSDSSDTGRRLHPVEFQYRNGQELGHLAILESLGGGLAILDFDRDGWNDVFATGGGSFTVDKQIVGNPSALFHSTGAWEFRRSEVTARIAASPYYSHGAAVTDFDNDGFPDVLITGYGGLQLHHNQGDGTFQEVAELAELTDTAWSSSAAWGDVNGDGNADLYVAHYVDWSFDNHPECFAANSTDRDVCPPKRFRALPDSLFISNGDGTFENRAQQFGLEPVGKSLGVVMADMDQDGDLDIYVASDTTNNLFYRNQQGTRFKEIGVLSGTAVDDSAMSNGSMGVDLVDFNADGNIDLFAANFERESFALYRHESDCFFRHVSQPMQVSAIGPQYVGWGTAVLDFDCDGDEDIAAVNGHVIRYPSHAPLNQRPVLFENQQQGLINVASQAGPFFASSHMARGMASGDLDNDGDVDLVVSRINSPIAFLRNSTEHDNAWLEVTLIGTSSAREPIGAIVTVSSNGKSIGSRHRKGGGSYASTVSPELHFGLGKATEQVDLEIRWPSGKVTRKSTTTTNKQITLVEPLRP